MHATLGRHLLFLHPSCSAGGLDVIRIGSSGDTPEDTAKFLQLANIVRKEKLLRADVLPPVEQLKVLQGYSRFAMAAALVQAVYGVIVRLAQDLDVSPMEAIAFVLNLIVVMKGMMHFYASTCHRPLVVVLDGDKESKFTAECELQQAPYEPSTNSKIVQLTSCRFVTVLPGGVLLFFIIKSAKFLPVIVAVPLIIAEAGTICGSCGLLLRLNISPKFEKNRSSFDNQ